MSLLQMEDDSLAGCRIGVVDEATKPVSWLLMRPEKEGDYDNYVDNEKIITTHIVKAGVVIRSQSCVR